MNYEVQCFNPFNPRVIRRNPLILVKRIKRIATDSIRIINCFVIILYKAIKKILEQLRRMVDALTRKGDEGRSNLR